MVKAFGCWALSRGLCGQLRRVRGAMPLRRRYGSDHAKGLKRDGRIGPEPVDFGTPCQQPQQSSTRTIRTMSPYTRTLGRVCPGSLCDPIDPLRRPYTQGRICREPRTRISAIGRLSRASGTQRQENRDALLGFLPPPQKAGLNSYRPSGTNSYYSRHVVPPPAFIEGVRMILACHPSFIPHCEKRLPTPFIAWP
jgi:hypothetical protein